MMPRERHHAQPGKIRICKIGVIVRRIHRIGQRYQSRPREGPGHSPISGSREHNGSSFFHRTSRATRTVLGRYFNETTAIATAVEFEKLVRMGIGTPRRVRSNQEGFDFNTDLGDVRSIKRNDAANRCKQEKWFRFRTFAKG